LFRILAEGGELNTEADTCRLFVVPRLQAAGWDSAPHVIQEQRTFTDGRVMFVAGQPRRGRRKRADYLLRYRPDLALAVVEAKPTYLSAADGLQQAKDYAEILGLKFAYATNGKEIIEFDFFAGIERVDEQRRIIARLDAVSAQLKARAEAAERQETEIAAMLRALAATDTTPTPMRELLTQRPLDVEVRREGQYQFSGVYSFGRGVFRAQRKSGAEFAYPRLTTLRAGDFTYPKLMAWEGAYGIVPAECDGTVVSPEFPVFAVNSDRVLPEILAVHFSDPRTWERLSGSSTGTNARRRRLHPDNLLGYEMPVPSPEIQALLRDVVHKATAIRVLNTAIAQDAAALMPAMLHQIFSPAAC
jgi:hypothetical protein